ncbi:TPA: hypothetical protein DEO28_05070 [Candidatus Dependentiae bacterium]|nr:MAG: hypothetical protein UR14_C0002G0127 [candidate division TM6 bacterium GW2011_GWE2_31_21]KKP53924.1 MAG: hypothetical protein UR43_C0002G0127 [candidate division TM6 bacterium GW2011_GWF2_33_332]HBS47704.1 hypothetical protein [Candidatus Dependentiae bacterium]HBZ73853.1 hypothetical protein [Candidatus Dependentiae bacterium]
MKKKILVVGEFTYGGASSSYWSIFLDLGFDAKVFNLNKIHRNFFCNLGKISFLVSFFHDLYINYSLKNTVKIFNPDFIFIAKGENISFKTIRYLKNNFQSKIVNFYPDNPFCFWNGNSNSNILLSLPFYDYFLIWSKMLIPVLESVGAKKVEYFPFAFDENLFDQKIMITKEDVEKYTSDVCFVGTWEPYREKWLNDLILKMPNLDLAIWGNEWSKNLASNSPLRNHLQGKAIYGIEMIKAFRLSKINLNFIRKQNITSHNMRTMEVPASRAFLLTERTVEQAQELFTENENIVCFSNVDELVEKIKFYLSNEKKRIGIMQKSYEKIQEYKLKDRLKNVLKKMGAFL